MEQPGRGKIWVGADVYERYVGRWSRLVAHQFLEWLALPSGARWLDIGCGTGALSEAILTLAAPSEVRGIDPSEGFVAYARARIIDHRARFDLGNAMTLAFESAQFDVVVSGLVLNFVPDARQALGEMARVVRPSGTIAAYVWDYAGQMQMMRYFWDAAATLNPEAVERDEGRRFPICGPDPLRLLFLQAGLTAVEPRAIDIPTRFRDFDDYWTPFVGGLAHAPAPAYAMSLSDQRRAALRERIRSSLPVRPDGTIDLIARAWAVRGRAL